MAMRVAGLESDIHCAEELTGVEVIIPTELVHVPRELAEVDDISQLDWPCHWV